MRNFLLEFIFPQKYETHTESHYLLFAISSVEQDSNVHGMAPSSLSTKPCILLPFHKSHLLPVSQMKLLLTEGYYSHTRALPSSVPWTIKVFKDSHSYLCKVSFQIFFFCNLKNIFTECHYGQHWELWLKLECGDL